MPKPSSKFKLFSFSYIINSKLEFFFKSPAKVSPAMPDPIIAIFFFH
jgi:hypothetical protein